MPGAHCTLSLSVLQVPARLQSIPYITITRMSPSASWTASTKLLLTVNFEIIANVPQSNSARTFQRTNETTIEFPPQVE